MYRLFKSAINKGLSPLGFEFQRTGRFRDPFFVQSRLLQKDSPVIFDVGANVGDVSAIYKNLFPSCTIHAFEPFPESFQKLQQRFGGDNSIRLNQVAVSEKEGHVGFNANSSSATNSILNTDPLAAHSWGDGLLNTGSTLQVSAVTIDAYCKRESVTQIDILKLDIQGAELQALHGARQMIKSMRVGVIYLELIFAPTYVGQSYFEDYLKFFRESGYVMLDMFNQARKNLSLIQADIIFVPIEKMGS